MNDRHRRRRRVEIYFVLYLVALVLLMPDSGDRSDRSTSAEALSETRLELFPDRMRLLCRLTRDTLGEIHISSLDSQNVVRYTGSLGDMKLSARVEDVETGQILTIDPDGSVTDMFRLEHQPQRNAVVFRWRPSFDQPSSRAFRVTVLGSGTPLLPSRKSSDDVFPAGLRMTGSTQFMLATLVENESPSTIINFVDGGRDTVYREVQSRNALASPGEFWIDVARDRISTIAGREWTNRVSVGGADPARDLVGLPKIRISGENVGEIQRFIDQRTIVIKGHAPRTGNIIVEVTAQRTDGQIRSATFVVNSQPLAAVDVPEVMYPNIEYTIDPRLPSIENSFARIRDGERDVTTAVDGFLRVKPTIRDTGKIFLFERTIDGAREGAPEQIVIRSFASPVIRDVKKEANQRKRTVVVQFFSHDRSVNRPMLRVIDGNASDPKKLSGYLRAADGQRPSTSWLEIFEVVPLDPNRPFTFRIQAVDERGRVSAVWVED